ncbi:MAG: DNA double-strand break repair nuclease NurA, partial [Candidatus Korarchaeota archaeon]|nr:DNA double-strand break repair nuclease NurA [Candidatus Korarchaeota archaeon]
GNIRGTDLSIADQRGSLKTSIAFGIITWGSQRNILAAIEKMISKTIVNTNFLPDPQRVIDSLKTNDNLVELLEDKLLYKLRNARAHTVFKDMNVIGIDGSSFSIRGHPIRIIVARSGIFVHSQRLRNVIRVSGPYKVIIRTLGPSGRDFEEDLRRAETESLAFIESKTALELANNFSMNVDLFFRDGPLYFPFGYDYDIETNIELSKLGIPQINVVKNCASQAVMASVDCNYMYDSDFFAYYLKPLWRSAFFLLKDVKFASNIKLQIDLDIKPVFTYVMSPKGNLIRYEIPYWVFSEYEPEIILDYITADLLLGEGNMSYIISRADSIAKFSELEKRMISEIFRKTVIKLGYKSPLFFNQIRWGTQSSLEW